MTDGGVPSARSTTILTDIAPVSWEHSADRAALQTLRSVPGFNEAVKKIAGFFGDRGVRLLFQANAVKVGPKQFPKLHTMLVEVCETMDFEEHPDLFVSQTPLVNAGAVGIDEPFVLLNSGALSILTDDETRVIIGHELGHIMSGHALYRTILLLILTVGIRNLPFLAGLALLPIQLALLEWYRKSELSADRAGLLATQDKDASLRVFLKLAGGGDVSQLDLEAFMEQAREYETDGGPVDVIYKILNTLSATHPFNTLRAAELDRWIEGGDYDKIMGGDYQRRSDTESERPFTEDVAEAAGYYTNEAKEVVGHVAEAARKAAQAFGQAFKNKPTE